MEPPLSIPGVAETRAWIAARAPATLDAFDRTIVSVKSGDTVVFSDPDSAGYAGAFLAALVSGSVSWCDNPKWGVAERDAAARFRSATPPAPAGSVFIPTGGSGGKIRFVRHDGATLADAVSGFSKHLGLLFSEKGVAPPIHAVQALPCCHVSGLMPVVRAWLTGGGLVFTDPSFRPGTPLPEMPATPGGVCVVSLVATQLHRLLERPDGPAWLREADMVLVGGSSVAPELLAAARAEKIPVGVSYGLTEVAALAALYPPERFLRNEPVAGDVLPHLRAEITPEGRVAFSGESLARDVRDGAGRYVTGDEGRFDREGRLVVTGRADRFIITGGEKVDPALVEAAIRATGLVREVHVAGTPDAVWGRAVTAYYCGDVTGVEIASALAGTLAPHRIPKRWLPCPGGIFDEKGKVDPSRFKPMSEADF